MRSVRTFQLQLQAMLAAASAASSSPLLGVLPKDKHEGALQATAASVLGASGMATADMSQGIAALFAAKEQPEVRRAATPKPPHS